MTKLRQQEILTQIIKLVTEMAEDNPVTSVTAEPEPEKVEMLTIKECTEFVPRLTEHTVRKLIAQDKVKYIRTGEGERGKFLINKSSLLSYLQK